MNNFKSAKITRREFLQIAALSPLLITGKPSQLYELSNPKKININSNILILLFDALSAAHMPLFDYPRATTPNIDRFINRSIVYHNHYAAGNFTSSGTASLLTGVYPWRHRAIHLHGTVLDGFIDKNLFSILPSDVFTLAYSHNLLVTSLLVQFMDHIQKLKMTRDLSLFDPQYSDILFTNDYNLSYWTEQHILRGMSTKPSSLFIALLYRFYRQIKKRKLENLIGDQFPMGIPNLNDIYLNLEKGIDWLLENITSFPTPFFCYVHFLPPHEPYMPRHEFVNMFKDGYKPITKSENKYSEGVSFEELAKQCRMYDEYIAYADAEFGRLIDNLQTKGLLDNTYIFLTSDHGELFERGIRGHVTPVLFDPILHIPLIISRPGISSRNDIYEPTSCVDILPTLAHLFGVARPEWCEGQILPGFNMHPNSANRSIFAVEAKQNPKFSPLTSASLTVIRDGYKLVWYVKRNEFEFYNLKDDPQELINLYSRYNPTAGDLRQELKLKLSLEDKPFLNHTSYSYDPFLYT